MQKLKNKLIFIGLLLIMLGFTVSYHTAFAATSDCQDSSSTGLQNCLKKDPIVTDLNVIVNFLSAGVGIVVIANIIIGGIQYSIAGDTPEAVSKAKKRITNALIAFVAFMLIFAFLQWVIPGGIFN